MYIIGTARVCIPIQKAQVRAGVNPGCIVCAFNSNDVWSHWTSALMSQLPFEYFMWTTLLGRISIETFILHKSGLFEVNLVRAIKFVGRWWEFLGHSSARLGAAGLVGFVRCQNVLRSPTFYQCTYKVEAIDFSRPMGLIFGSEWCTRHLLKNQFGNWAHALVANDWITMLISFT